MEPIDHFVADVEASGEDKKHEAPMPVAMPLPKGYLMWNPERLQDGRWFCHVQPVLQGAASEPMYTYADVVHYGNRCAQAAAAEAVKQERTPRGLDHDFTAEAKQLMFVLSAEQRMDVMSSYCRYCGCDNPDCSCWNDE